VSSVCLPAAAAAAVASGAHRASPPSGRGQNSRLSVPFLSLRRARPPKSWKTPVQHQASEILLVARGLPAPDRLLRLARDSDDKGPRTTTKRNSKHTHTHLLTHNSYSHSRLFCSPSATRRETQHLIINTHTHTHTHTHILTYTYLLSLGPYHLDIPGQL